MKTPESTAPYADGYSREVAEILRRKPSYFLRNGITLLLLLIAALIAGSYFIPYPERTSVQVTFLSADGEKENRIAGIAKIPAEIKAALHPEQQVILVLYRQSDQEFRLRIRSAEPYGQTGQTLLVLQEPLPEILPGETGLMTFHTGSTSMFAKMLTPFISVFSHDHHH